MNDIIIEQKYKLPCSNSKGSQIKYKYQNKFYKLDTMGKESISEELATIVLMHSNTNMYVNYSRCKVNGRDACVSDNFLKEGESLIYLDKLFNMTTSKSLEDELYTLEVKDRFTYLVEVFNTITGLDLSLYLYKTFCMDLLTLNPDRHFKNLAVIYSESRGFRLAPLFDFGQGLGSNYSITPPYLSEEECVDKLFSCTISGSFEQQVLCSDMNLVRIDYNNLLEELGEYPDCRQLRLLKLQLNKYKKLFMDDANPLLRAVMALDVSNRK